MKPVCLVLTIASGNAITPLTTDHSISCNAIFIEPDPNNGNGPYLVGNADLAADKSAGVIHVIPGPTDNFTMPQGQSGSNQLSPADYRITSPNANDIFYVTYWVA